MKFILHSEPKVVQVNKDIIENIESKLKDDMAIDEEEVTILLDYICYETRCKLSHDLENETFESKDLRATSIISNYFNSLNVVTHACNTKINIDEDIVNNYFLTIEINTNLYGQSIKIPYLIDTTYRQFFLKERCNSEYEIIKNGFYIRKENPGYFIHPYDKEEISVFLRDGYALLDPEFSSIYGNSFLNTKIYTKDERFLCKNSFEYFDSFLKDNDVALISKEKLEKQNLLIEPINPFYLKR